MVELRENVASVWLPRKGEKEEPVALVIGQVPDLRELLVRLVHQRPIHFAHRNNVAVTAAVSDSILLRHF